MDQQIAAYGRFKYDRGGDDRYHGLCETLMHLRLLLRELGREQQQPTIVYEDNQAAVKLTAMPEQSKRAKHYQMKVHFLKGMVKNGVYRYIWISTHDQVADGMTKCLPRDQFCKLRNMMGMS